MNLLGGLRETGDLPLFSPKGRTYSPPRRHKLHILCPAASGRSHPFRCASFSHKVNDFVGALLRRWYALRHRALSEGDCGCCGSLQTMPQHLWALLSSSVQTANSLRQAQRIGAEILYPMLPPACANLPPAALFAAMTRCSTSGHFLFYE